MPTPTPRWSSRSPFYTVSIPDLRLPRRRLSRAKREVLAMIGENAARRAFTVQTCNVQAQVRRACPVSTPAIASAIEGSSRSFSHRNSPHGFTSKNT
jgi:hypothetical protein